jgi:hypothetical protein
LNHPEDAVDSANFWRDLTGNWSLLMPLTGN